MSAGNDERGNQMTSAEALKMICHPSGCIYADYNSHCTDCKRKPCKRMLLVGTLLSNLRDTESNAEYQAKRDARRGAPSSRDLAHRAKFFEYRARVQNRLIDSIGETACTCSEHNH